MTLKLISVELFNIRNHEHFLFEPMSQGITALMGASGSGKSSIVDSVAWALYGSKPDGVKSNPQLCRDGISAKEVAKAVVTLDIDSDIIVVSRQMTGAKRSTNCSVYRQDKDGNLDQIAGDGVIDANKKIRSLVGMDERGFLASVFIQQKQVDNIVNGKNHERKAIIEDLTGITSVSKAQAQAKRELNDKNSQIKGYSLSGNDIEDMESSLDKMFTFSDKLSNRISSDKKRLDTMVEELDEYEEKLLGYEKRNRAYDNAESRINSNKEFLETTKADLESIKADREELKGKTGLFDEASFREIKQERDEAKKKLDDARQKLASLESMESQYRSQREKAVEALGSLEMEELTADDFDSSIRSCEESIVKAKAGIVELRSKTDAANADIKSILSAISTLESENGHCPTCLQSVDSVTAAVASLNGRIRELEEDKSSYDDERAGLESKKSTSEKELDSYLDGLEAFRSLKESDEFLADVEERKTVLMSDVSAFSTSYDTYDEVFRSHQDSERNTQKYRELGEKVVEKMKLVAKYEKAIKDDKQVMSENPLVSTHTLDMLDNRIDKAKKAIDDLEEKIADNKAEVKVLNSEMRGLEKDIENEKKNREGYKRLCRSRDETKLAYESIQAFRQNLVNTAIPTVESKASDLLHQFTNGALTSVGISDDFDVSVMTAGGVERPVNALSGGEVSATAMALRLAISMMLSGNADNMLILDEVMVSQDEARTENMLMVFKEMFKGQVVLIAHNGNTDAIVDKSLEL